MEGGIELADVIRQVRGELALAMWEGEGKDLRFELGPVELELELAVERSVTPGAKVRLLVVEVSAGGQRASSMTHRIRLTLEPRTVDDPDRRPWVSGPAVPGEE